MALNNSGRNAAANGVASNVGYVSLHTADPGTTGTNEVTGGTPAYARKAVAWSTASGGVAAISGGVTFDVPASTSISYIGLWSTATGGTFYGGAALSATETYGGQGTYNLTALTITIT
ncbi:MAG TPA: hypothetical protein VE326_11525 [Candidatus Binatia bacterium]|nr:hypothetical protein [Candidatus Binatia bacterium]